MFHKSKIGCSFYSFVAVLPLPLKDLSINLASSLTLLWTSKNIKRNSIQEMNIIWNLHKSSRSTFGSFIQISRNFKPIKRLMPTEKRHYLLDFLAQTSLASKKVKRWISYTDFQILFLYVYHL